MSAPDTENTAILNTAIPPPQAFRRVSETIRAAASGHLPCPGAAPRTAPALPAQVAAGAPGAARPERSGPPPGPVPAPQGSGLPGAAPAPPAGPSRTPAGTY
ncbi:hypothetical protein GCM10009605_38200 [Nocardiopsis composta]